MLSCQVLGPCGKCPMHTTSCSPGAYLTSSPYHWPTSGAWPLPQVKKTPSSQTKCIDRELIRKLTSLPSKQPALIYTVGSPAFDYPGCVFILLGIDCFRVFTVLLIRNREPDYCRRPCCESLLLSERLMPLTAGLQCEKGQ